jgi:hypothetical protein
MATGVSICGFGERRLVTTEYYIRILFFHEQTPCGLYPYRICCDSLARKNEISQRGDIGTEDGRFGAEEGGEERDDRAICRGRASILHFSLSLKPLMIQARRMVQKSPRKLYFDFQSCNRLLARHQMFRLGYQTGEA